MYGMCVVVITNTYIINGSCIYVGIKLNAQMEYEVRKRYGTRGEVLYFDIALSKTHPPIQMCRDGYFLVGTRYQKTFSLKAVFKLKALNREYK